MKFAFVAPSIVGIFLALPVVAQTTPDFGDDSSEFAFDHECDDPRFTGWGVATSTSTENTGTDASDCSHLYSLGQIRLSQTESKGVEQCASINYGDNSSQWSNNNECDDPRFAGGGVPGIMNLEDIGRDAADCQSLCESGSIWLR